MYILGSHSSMVHAPSGLHPHGWNPSVRSLLHWTLLHLLRDLWEPVLLPLRVPVPRVCHPCDLLLTDLDRDGLFPALRRGLSLVVEVILFLFLNLDVNLNIEKLDFFICQRDFLQWLCSRKVIYLPPPPPTNYEYPGQRWGLELIAK